MHTVPAATGFSAALECLAAHPCGFLWQEHLSCTPLTSQQHQKQVRRQQLYFPLHSRYGREHGIMLRAFAEVLGLGQFMFYPDHKTLLLPLSMDSALQPCVLCPHNVQTTGKQSFFPCVVYCMCVFIAVHVYNLLI